MNETFGFNDIAGGGGGEIHGLSIPVVVSMVALVFIVGLLSSRALRDRSLIVRHLFLKTNLRVQDRSQISYIRSLDLTGGVLVMSSAPAKGTIVEIDLGSLPRFPDATAKIDAQVKKVSQLGGQPTNFLVQVKFDKSKRFIFNGPLTSYLKQLIA